MMWRVGGHLRRKCDSWQIEIITAWLQVGDRCCCAIYFSHGGWCRLDRPIQVDSRGKEEVEKGRWPSTARLQHRRLPAGDEQPLSGAEHFGLATERDLGRSRDLV